MKNDATPINLHTIDSPLIALVLILFAGTLLINGILEVIQIFNGADVSQVSLVRRYGACFVIYKDDIETIPCPTLEKP